MTTVNVTKTINIPAQTAWDKLSSFSGIEHFSPIERSIVQGTGVGAKRSCFLPENVEIKEELTKLDNNSMTFEYVILSGPFPISNYVSTVSISSKGNEASEISWTANFVVGDVPVEEMKGLFAGFYNAIIDGLEKLVIA